MSSLAESRNPSGTIRTPETLLAERRSHATWDYRTRPLTDALHAALKLRLRAVLDDRPVTETELSNLIEEGSSCDLILAGRLRGIEKRLADLSADPTSSLADIATEIRAANEVRPDLDELRALMAQVSALARTFRASWLSGGA
jgi:hypothetical protein